MTSAGRGTFSNDASRFGAAIANPRIQSVVCFRPPNA
jgi:hypothetical protein